MATTRPWSDMSASRLFIDDFDAPERPPEPEVIQPSFSATDLAAAREEAWAEGREAGQAQAAVQHEDEMRRCMAAMADQLAMLRTELRAHAETQAEAVARLMFDALRVLFPALCVAHGETEVAALVAALLPGLVHQPAVTIRVHPQLLEALAGQIAAREATGRIEVMPMETIQPGDVRVAWSGGAAARETDKLWDRVAAVLSQAGLAVRHHVARELDHAA